MKGTPSQISGPKLLDAMPETQDTSIVHVLPCQDFQHAMPNGDRGLSAREGCEILGSPERGKSSFERVKGVHWGTWSENEFGSGKNFHEKQLLPIYDAMHQAQGLRERKSEHAESGDVSSTVDHLGVSKPREVMRHQ